MNLGDPEIEDFDPTALDLEAPPKAQAAELRLTHAEELGLDPRILAVRTRTERRLLYDLSGVDKAVAQLKALPRKGETIHCLMGGEYHGFDLIPAIHKMAGDFEEIWITTLGFNARNITHLMTMVDTGAIDLETTGFSIDDIERMMAGTGKSGTEENEPQVNRADELKKKYGTAVGQMWELGDQLLACGDATDPKVFKRLMGGDLAQCVFTDPPYGVSYQSKHGAIKGDSKTGDKLALTLLLPAFKACVRASEADAAFYIWHANRDDFAYAMKAAGLIERQYLIWIKPVPVMGHGDYQWSHEACFYASKEKAPAFFGDRAQSTVWRMSLRTRTEASVDIGNGVSIVDGHGNLLAVRQDEPKGKKTRTVRLPEGGGLLLTGDHPSRDCWEIRRDTSRPDHPTQKPVELAERAILNSSESGDIILDPFLGSGTTLIAAERLERRCRGIELDPGYAAVVIDRWERLTGKKPRLRE